jgi:FkbM family methyltransferase
VAELEHLRPGVVVADIGAHIGFLTFLMARLVGDTGRVYAFEPAPENVAYLTRNVASNGATNVVVVPVAAGANNGNAPSRRRQRYGLPLPGNPFSRTRGTVEVEQVSVDDVVPFVDVAKIDVEGAEIEVLRGMGRLLAHEPKPIPRGRVESYVPGHGWPPAR